MSRHPARGEPRAGMRLLSSLRQSEHGECSTERGIVAQCRVAADRAETRGWVGQAGRKANTCPTADAGQNGNVLPAVMLVCRDVADDAGRGLELVELLAGLGVDRFQIAFQRSVKYDAAGGRKCA